MTENLRLEFDGTANTGLTANDSNIDSKYTSSNPLIISETQARTAIPTTAEINEWKSSDPPTKAQVDRWLSRGTQGKRESDNTTGDLTGENQYLGTYYNWYTATAGTGTYALKAGEVAPNDICPNGWQLVKPKGLGSWVYLIRDIYRLITKQGDQGSAAVNDMLHRLPFSLPYAGFVSESNATTVGQGSRSPYWSSGAYYSNAYSFSIDAGGNSIWLEGVAYKSTGMPMRCIAL